MESNIKNVIVKPLVSHGDQRGFFREIIRSSDEFFHDGGFAQCFAQWSHSKMQKNVVKAWHYHHIQYDWWYLPIGVVETVLIDNRQESPTYKQKMIIRMGDSNISDLNAKEVCVCIPPGVLHGCKVLSEEAHLFYITSQIYTPNEEGRIPYNATDVNHNWGEDVIVVENDKRWFTPTSIRNLV